MVVTVHRGLEEQNTGVILVPFTGKTTGQATYCQTKQLCPIGMPNVSFLESTSKQSEILISGSAVVQPTASYWTSVLPF